MSTSSGDVAPALVLLPEQQARAALSDRPLRLLSATPPYPCIGVGILRVLRVRETADQTDVLVGYDRYDRLPA